MSSKSTPHVIRRGLLAVAAAMALVLSGCAATQDPKTSDATLTVVSAYDAAPNQLFGGSFWFAPVLEPLVRQDGKTGKPVAVLASEWKQAADLTSISVTIKKGITFHSGKTLTIDDVVFSFKEALKPQNNSRAASVAANVSSIKATGDDQMTITFKSPTSNMWDLLYFTPIVDPSTYSGIADGTDVDGTGPFVWKSWSPGKEIVLEKYDKYRDAKRVHYQKIDVAVIVDATAQQSALRSGRAELGVGFSTQDATTLAKSGSFTTQQVAVSTLGMGLNTSVAPFNNKSVRQAIGYAIDRKRLIDQASAGVGEPISLWWGKQYPGWDAKQNDYYSYQPDKAREMIKKAGATGASIPLIFPASAFFQAFYEIIADGLTKAGLVPTAVPIDGNEAVDRLQRGDLGPGYILIDSGLSTMDPSTMMASTPMFITGDKSPQKFSDPKYDELRNRVSASSGAELVTAMHELNAYLLDQAFNLAVVNTPNLNVVGKALDTSEPGVYTVYGALTGLDIQQK